MAALGASYAAMTTLVPHAATSFTWRVEGITAARVAAASVTGTEPVRSPEFMVDGEKWCIDMFLRGCNRALSRSNEDTVIMAKLLSENVAKTMDISLTAAGRSCTLLSQKYYCRGCGAGSRGC
jgi:hypothetical protein